MKVLRLISLGWIIPAWLMFVVYFGFTTNYTRHVFSEPGFRAQYSQSVFRYRPLGTALQLATGRLLENAELPRWLRVRALPVLDAQGSLTFYTAYFINNTLFLCLACTVLFLLFDRMLCEQGQWVRDLTLLFMTCLMVISQYVIVPYDSLSYLLLIVAAWLTLVRPSVVARLALGAVIILATLTRESAILILSLDFAARADQLVGKRRSLAGWKTFLPMCACYAAAYVALRFVYGWNEGIYKNVNFEQNLSQPNTLGSLLFLVAASAVVIGGAKRPVTCWLYTLASLPYLLPIVIVGYIFEMRLWVPYLLLLVIAATCLPLVSPAVNDRRASSRPQSHP